METVTIVLLEDSSAEDSENLQELCQSLQTSSLQLADAIEDTYQHFKLIRRKVKDEEYSLDKMPLKPRAHTRAWMAAHGLPEQVCFEEFFAVILDELAKDNRLDLSARSLLPNTHLAALCKIPVDQPIHIMDFLSLVPTLFH